MNQEVLHKKFIAHTYVDRELAINRGEGPYVFDENGKRYLDFTSGFGAAVLGHNNPVINKVLREQSEQLISLHSSFISQERSNAAKALVDVVSNSYGQRSLVKVYFGSSGSEAIEAAIKFAYFSVNKEQDEGTPAKTQFIYARRSFHGKTLGALSVMGNARYKDDFEHMLPTHISVPFGNTEALKNSIGENTCAVILEPIQGEGGIVVPPDDYLEEVRDLCRQHNVLLILDEIQSGMGRTGHFLASQKHRVVPDILCLGKGLAGGLPISATMLTNEINNKLKIGVHSSTFGGNPLCTAVMDTVVREVAQDTVLDHVGDLGRYFMSGLKSLNKQSVQEVRGEGLFVGIKISTEETPVLKSLQGEGLLALPTGNNVIRFLPPYIIDKSHVDEALDMIDKVLI